MRNVGGLPISVWAVGIIAGVVGFVWMRKRSTASSPGAPGGQAGQPSFTQQQEVQDFQIFSSLTGAQQASDLNFLSEVAGLFAGGSSTATPPSTTPPSTTPAPPSNPTPPPSTTPSPTPTANQGYGTVQTAQGQMVWLGVNQAGSPVYNVGGGAPVYFGNASALAQGAQYEQPGYDMYTPVGYENMVSSGPTALGQPYVAGG